MNEAIEIKKYRTLLGMVFMSGDRTRYNLTEEQGKAILYYEEEDRKYFAQVPLNMVDLTKKFLNKKESPEERRRLMGWKDAIIIKLNGVGSEMTCSTNNVGGK